MQLTDQQLDHKAIELSKKIKSLNMELIEVLVQINRRHSYADHGYSSLFNYIVNFLGFSDSQAALYNNIIKSKLAEDEKVMHLLKTEQVSLNILGVAGNYIKNHRHHFASKVKMRALVSELKGKSRDEAKRTLLAKPETVQKSTKKKYKLEISEKNLKLLEKMKQKLDAKTDDEVLSYLLNLGLTRTTKIRTNKSITAKSRAALLKKAGCQCEYVSREGVRCQARSYLQIDHIHPRALGGGNEAKNLRVFCATHNQRAAVLQFGADKVNYFASKVK